MTDLNLQWLELLLFVQVKNSPPPEKATAKAEFTAQTRCTELVEILSGPIQFVIGRFARRTFAGVVHGGDTHAHSGAGSEGV